MNPLRKTAVAAAISLVFTTPVCAVDGQIALLFGEDCDIQLGPLCSTRMYVYGMLLGASGPGLTGAEYSIEFTPVNLRGNFLFTETYVPGALVLGAGAIPPVKQARGVNIAFASCQTGDASRVLLETIDVLRLDFGLPQEISLKVVKHDRPSSQFFQCPLFTVCDAPVYTKVCVGSNLTTCPNPEPPFPNNATCSTSGQAWINGRQCCLSCEPGPVNCTVAAAPTAWSRVKALYR